MALGWHEGYRLVYFLRFFVAIPGGYALSYYTLRNQMNVMNI